MSWTHNDVPSRIWFEKYEPYWMFFHDFGRPGTLMYPGIWKGRKFYAHVLNKGERMRVRNALAVGWEPMPHPYDSNHLGMSKRNAVRWWLD